jgi:hypothetical protein
MIDIALIVSLGLNAGLLWALIRSWEIAIAEKEEPKQVPETHVLVEKAIAPKKPFRAKKSFREVKKQFEDERDPRRMARERVEKFAAQENEYGNR